MQRTNDGNNLKKERNKKNKEEEKLKKKKKIQIKIKINNNNNKIIINYDNNIKNIYIIIIQNYNRIVLI